MASFSIEITTKAVPETVWDAIKDIGALHTRFVPGFVVHTALEQGARVVTFGNGMQVRTDHRSRRNKAPACVVS